LVFNLGEIDPEMGLPILLRTILPPGILGLMMAAYFSAVLSTADSCLMAASGNLSTDIFGRWLKTRKESSRIRFSQLFTLVLGSIALGIALQMTNVLGLMLYSYAFMVSGLLVPILFGLFTHMKSPWAAVSAMISGGTVTIGLGLIDVDLFLGLDPNFFGILTSLAMYLLVYYSKKSKKQNKIKEYA
jgi:solute:Na+ symporter, SSS family